MKPADLVPSIGLNPFVDTSPLPQRTPSPVRTVSNISTRAKGISTRHNTPPAFARADDLGLGRGSGWKEDAVANVNLETVIVDLDYRSRIFAANGA
jgi:hypothetical protein